jgi:hypothetical protein
MAVLPVVERPDDGANAEQLPAADSISPAVTRLQQIFILIAFLFMFLL